MTTESRMPNQEPSADGKQWFHLYMGEPEKHIAGVFWYYAILAYPKAGEWGKRTNFVEAMIAMRFKEFAAAMGSRKSIPARFRRYKHEKMLGRINMGWKRIEKRVMAGQIGWCICLNGRQHPFDAPTEDGKIGVSLKGPMTVMDAIRAYLKSRQTALGTVHLEELAAEANATHRVWAESLPVLHLAMEHPEVRRIIEGQGNSQMPEAGEPAKFFFESMHDPSWLRDTLNRAEKLCEDLPSCITANPKNPHGLGYSRENAIRLIPTDDPTLAFQFPKLSRI